MGQKQRRRRSCKPSFSSSPLSLCLFVCLCTSVIQPILAQTSEKQMIVIVVPGLRADDLKRPELTTLRRLATRGAIGWMNTRTARVPGQKRDPIEAAYLTLGAGARATAGPYARVITPSTLTLLKAENAKLDHPVHVGALGDMLHRAGLKTHVLGNEDDTEPGRAAIMIAMDSQGSVDRNASESIGKRRTDQPVPYGITDEIVHPAIQKGPFSFRVWVIGDIARADRYAPLCLPKIAQQHRSNALRRLDSILNDNVRTHLPGRRYILLAPAPADSAPPGDRLAPMLMFGDGIQPGLLTSASTKRPGLLANTDFLPTVAAYFGLKPPEGMVGRPITVTPLSSTTPWWEPLMARVGLRTSPAIPLAELWASLHDRWAARAAQQAALGGLPTLQCAIALAVMIVWWWRFPSPWKGEELRVRVEETYMHLLTYSAHPDPHLTGEKELLYHPLPLQSKRVFHLLHALPLATLCLPLALFVLPLFVPSSVIGAVLVLTAVLLAMVIIALRWPDSILRIAMVALGTLVAGVVLDLLIGGVLLRQAWMSYSMMEGARYYGIGNEYAAAVFAGALLCSYAFLQGTTRWKLPAVLVLLLTLALLIGMPAFGANAGGCLAALAGFGVAGWLWMRGRLHLRDIIALLVVACLLVFLVLVADLLRGAEHQSHIARAITGGESIANILWRKLSLNFYLLFHSPWSLSLLSSATGVWLLFRHPESSLRPLMKQDRIAYGTAMGALTGVIALLVFNDSGVVAAAEAMMLFWAFACVRLCTLHEPHR